MIKDEWLPQGAFKNSGIGTSIDTLLVVINKPSKDVQIDPKPAPWESPYKVIVDTPELDPPEVIARQIMDDLSKAMAIMDGLHKELQEGPKEIPVTRESQFPLVDTRDGKQYSMFDM